MKTGKDFRRIIRQHYFQSQKGISNTSEMKKESTASYVSEFYSEQTKDVHKHAQEWRKKCFNV